MVLCLVLFLPMWAQDIIVTTSSERIDAKVLEVSETEVKYKRHDNLQGPTFVISTSNIASIIYQNGDVQTFKQTAAAPATVSQATNNGTVITVRDAADIVFVPGQTIERSDKRNRYYYGNVELDEGLYKDFLKLTCEDAYRKYAVGDGLAWGGYLGGSIMLGAGLGCLLVRNASDGALIAGGVLMAAGLATGVTLICVGVKQESKALDVFNEQCASSLDYRQAMTLNFGVTQNGVGLTLNF